ncbi:MAG: IS4 family transposase [Sporolactobacillus sp.]
MKKLTVYTFLQLLVVAQINECDSLTELSKYSEDKEELQLHLHLDGISTSQLSRTQSHLPPALFEKVFRHLVLAIQAQMKQSSIVRHIGRLCVIDSSTMSMSISQHPWATFRKTKAGVKLHLRVVVTQDLTLPDQAVLLPAKHADRSQMNGLIEIDPDALYLFDRGYVDYKQFDHYCFDGVRFITRLKKIAEIEILAEQSPDPEHFIDQDAKVSLGNAQTKTKMKHPLRLIKTKDQDGNSVILVTNCFDLTAQEIGDLYQYRWKIEIFFKWMKQHLKIKSFYGKSENAVYNQIWIALITYCLEVLIQLRVGHDGRLLELKRTLETCLFKGLDAFIRALFRKPTRSSEGQDWEKEFDWVCDNLMKARWIT